MELLKLLGYINAMVGYCQSLRAGTVITEDYIKRMNDYYVPNTLKAAQMIAELFDNKQVPKRESGNSCQKCDAEMLRVKACENIAEGEGYDIAPAVLPCPLRQYADRNTQKAFEANQGGAANTARMVTESTLETEALRERIWTSHATGRLIYRTHHEAQT